MTKTDWQKRIEKYLAEHRTVSGGAIQLLKPPQIFIVQLAFNGVTGGFPIAGTGLISNFPVTLPAKFTRVAKLNSNEATTWPVNNIFMHFTPFTDTLGAGNAATGRLLQLGSQVDAFPLELGEGINFVRKYKFSCGIPTSIYLSADFQGTGNYTNNIAFWNDDFDYDQYERGY